MKTFFLYNMYCIYFAHKLKAGISFCELEPSVVSLIRGHFIEQLATFNSTEL